MEGEYFSCGKRAGIIAQNLHRYPYGDTVVRNRLIYVYFVEDDSACETERKVHSTKHMAKHPKTTAATRVFKKKIHNTQSVQSIAHRDRAWVDFAIHKMLRTVQMEKYSCLGP